MREFSRRYTLTAIGETGQKFALQATDAERQALTKLLDILEVQSLDAQGNLSLTRDGARAEGVFKADLVVPCAGTGEPMPLHVEELFSVQYMHHIKAHGGSGRDAEGHAAWTLSDLEEDTEELAGDVLDLGETILQHLILAMPLAPKQNTSETLVVEEAGTRPHPFAALGALKADKPKDER